MAVVYYQLNNDGWLFKPDYPGCTPDPLFEAKALKEVYDKASTDYEGRYTVPVLWDKKENTIGTLQTWITRYTYRSLDNIVSNESSEIIRMFNTEFDDFVDEKYKGVTYYPDELKSEIDDINDWGKS